MERERFPPAGLVTPRSGGLGIVPAGIMTGERLLARLSERDGPPAQPRRRAPGRRVALFAE
jgi:hypothetical protein